MRGISLLVSFLFVFTLLGSQKSHTNKVALEVTRVAISALDSLEAGGSFDSLKVIKIDTRNNVENKMVREVELLVRLAELASTSDNRAYFYFMAIKQSRKLQKTLKRASMGKVY